MKLTYLILLSIFIVVACDQPIKEETKKKGNNSHHHAKGSHGGEILESGKLHLEFVHDKKLGKISLYFLGSDAKTPQKLSAIPVINVKTDAGPMQVKSTALNGDTSIYEATKDIFKESLKGRIAVDFEGKRLNFDIPVDHGHDDHGHDDHGHDDHGHDH